MTSSAERLFIQPAYSTPEPNVPIRLYEGSFEVEQDSGRVVVTGYVDLMWVPSPAIQIAFNTTSTDSTNRPDVFKLGLASLYLPRASRATRIDIITVRLFSDEYFAREWEPLCVGDGQNLTHMVLHLVNFPNTYGMDISNPDSHCKWLGRFVLGADGWKTTVDKVEHYSSLYKSLRSFGGYAITHTVKLEREDGGSFTADQADILLEDLRYFFSFANGCWTDTTLKVGFDENGTAIWEQWGRPQASSWRYVSSWFNDYKPEPLTRFWSDFYTRLHNPLWDETLRRAIKWYLTANIGTSMYEGDIILAQAGHELLAWTLFVAEGGLTFDGFYKLPASDKLRLLLQRAQVPTKVPTSLQFLDKLCHADKWVDGPDAVTQIRNKLVHPNPKNLQKLQNLSVNDLQDARILSMWYLELTLLYILGYKDEYVSRLNYTTRTGQTEPVPWL